jgi:hypothetical protein
VLGPAGYERLAWHSLRAIHLVLFAARRFRRQVLGIHGSTVATGIGNVVGNKVRQTARVSTTRGTAQELAFVGFGCC